MFVDRMSTMGGFEYVFELQYEYGIKGYPTKIYQNIGEWNDFVTTINYE